MSPKLSERHVALVAQMIPHRVVRTHNEAAELCSPVKAKRELARFLVACTAAHEPLTPSCIVDALWHEFVLDTTQYDKFCTEQLGVFVHHVPSDQPCALGYERTIKFLRAAFGRIDPRYWPRSAAGDCSSKCSNCGANCQTRAIPLPGEPRQ
jgi:hypothetical protein